MPFKGLDFDNLFENKNDLIEFRKFMSKFRKEAEEKAKPKKCVLCNKECTSFCNSHTIPQFVLKNMGNKGNYITGQSLLASPAVNEVVGLNSVITFHTICNECDSTFFQNYEDEKSLSGKVDNKILSKIALKNYLRTYSKRLVEREMNLAAAKEFPPFRGKVLVDEIDISDNYSNIIYAKKNGCYYLIDEITLNYVVPIAYQGELNLITGFDGEIINNIFCYDKAYKLQGLNICIFPLEHTTKILLFIKDGDIRYRKFYKKFKKLSLKEKLYSINFIVLLYAEEWVIHPKFKIARNDEETIKKMRTLFDGIDDHVHIIEEEITDATIKTEGEVFNFLEHDVNEII